MKLPVNNESYAISKAISLNLLVLVLVSTYLILSFNLTNLIASVLTFLIVLMISWIYIQKQKIKKAELDGNVIKVDFKNRLINIPLNNIGSVTSALSYYINKNGEPSIIYSLNLNKKYQFGRVLYLEFDEKRRLEDEPEKIRILKERMKNGC